MSLEHPGTYLLTLRRNTLLRPSVIRLLHLSGTPCSERSPGSLQERPLERRVAWKSLGTFGQGLGIDASQGCLARLHVPGLRTDGTVLLLRLPALVDGPLR